MCYAWYIDKEQPDGNLAREGTQRDRKGRKEYPFTFPTWRTGDPMNEYQKAITRIIELEDNQDLTMERRLKAKDRLIAELTDALEHCGYDPEDCIDCGGPPHNEWCRFWKLRHVLSYWKGD